MEELSLGFSQLSFWEAAKVVSAGATTISALASFWLIGKHLKWYTCPEQQRCIVRIIFMIPVYAIISCLSLFLPRAKTYFGIVRDSYEAYALYMFFRLIVNYAAGDESIVNILDNHPPLRAFFPLTCIKFKPSKKTLTLCRRLIVQYAIVRPLIAVLASILLIFHEYHEGKWDFTQSYPYLAIVNNISVSSALYCVVLMYQLLKHDLAPYKPLGKFMSIKMVVFFCYWQSVAISLLGYLDWLPHIQEYPEEDVQVILQNLLICFEMLIFSIAHFWAFPWDIYKEQTRQGAYEPIKFHRRALDVVNQNDLVKDTVQSFVPKKMRIKKGDRSAAIEKQSLLGDDSLPYQ
eukprot:TRINITY_DN11388_c0_g1_i1.p1 TRINITY_DN11388_c0_g1~~TRINITY_DN11388_c0_g1_i1.p1  ORF type:complete len:347 (+),score=43.38 TRINITY_DN11388_c0_g1_i1:11-1051(+)